MGNSISDWFSFSFSVQDRAESGHIVDTHFLH